MAADMSASLQDRLAALSLDVLRPSADHWVIGADDLADCEIAVVRSPYRFQPGAIAQSCALKLIVRAGSGLDGIPVAEAQAGAVEVRSVALASRSVAEHAMGLLLSAARHQSLMHTALLRGQWLKPQARGIELFGSTLLIVGFGAVGRDVAKIADAFGMRLLVADRSPSVPEKQVALAALANASFVSLEEGVRVCDAIVLCCPAQVDGTPLLDKQLFALAGRPFLLVNVGRGSLIEEAALKEALDDDRVIGAGLDVLQGEPNPDPALINHPKVVATPHIGAQTTYARTQVEDAVFRHIEIYCTEVA